MIISDPTLNIPELARPRDSLLGFLSPPRPRSISPSRRDRNLSTDVTSRCISPDSTLRIIRNSQSLTTSTREDRLVDCIRDTAPAERAFGVSVLQACRDIRDWAALVESWEWPGTFAPPPQDERETIFRDMLLEAGLDQSQIIDLNSCSSLPEQIIAIRKAELNRIKHALNLTDVDALKRHIARRTTTRPSVALPGDISPIDEFDGIVTNAILKALPYLSWLQNLLAEWQTRLLVLRKVPAFLDRLSALEAEPLEKTQSPEFRKELIEVGKILDRMLDYLEGRPETLPDEWIDRFEQVESRLPAPLSAAAHSTVLDLGALKADSVSPVIDHAGAPSQMVPAACPVRSISPAHTVHRPESPVLGSEPFSYAPTDYGELHTSGQSIYEKEMIDQIISEAQNNHLDLGLDEPASAVMTSIPSFPVFLATDFSPERLSAHAEPSGHREARDFGTELGLHVSSAPALDGHLPIVSEEGVSELDSQPGAPTSAVGEERIQALELIDENPTPRPLEYASSAFTKLFSSRSRSESTSSRSSIRQRMTPSIRSSISSKRASDLSIGRNGSILSLNRDKERATPRPTNITPALSAAQPLARTQSTRSAHKHTSSLDSLSNWAPVGSRSTQQDTSDLQGIIQADLFERLFVDSLPAGEASTSPSSKRDSKVDGQNDDRITDKGPSSTRALTFNDLSFDQIVDTCGLTKPMLQDPFVKSPSRTADIYSVVEQPASTGEAHAVASAAMASIEHFARSSAVHSTRPQARPSLTPSQVKTADLSHPTESPPEDVLGLLASLPSQRRHKKASSESHATKMGLVSKDYGRNRSNSASAVASDLSSHSLALLTTPIAGKTQSDKPLPDTPETSPEDCKLRAFAAANTQIRRGNAVHNFSQPLKGVQRGRQPMFKSGNQIDQRINTLLQDLPKHISFVPGARAAADASADNIGIAVDTFNPPNPTTTLATAARSNGHSGGITLTSAPDAETTNGYGGKTYYLSMTGTGRPIKLYVRLVGEDERVMVRVGGGWTDLSDYLRLFSQHHGSKTSMESRITMEQADRSGDAVARSRSTTPSGRLTPSGRSTPKGRSTPTELRSTSAQAVRGSNTPEAGLTSPGAGSTCDDTPGYTYTHTRTRRISQAPSPSPSTWGPFPTIDNTSSPRISRARAGFASGRVRGDDRSRNGWVEEMLERAKNASLEQKVGMTNSKEGS